MSACIEPNEDLILHPKKIKGFAAFLDELSFVQDFKESLASKPFATDNYIDVRHVRHMPFEKAMRLTGLSQPAMDGEISGSRLELIGVRWMAVPHVDDHIAMPWSHFVVIDSDGLALQNLGGMNRTCDLPDEIISLNIHEPHWVVPDNDALMTEPFIWYGITFSSTRKLSTKRVLDVFMEYARILEFEPTEIIDNKRHNE